jgi:hypothetical protein
MFKVVKTKVSSITYTLLQTIYSNNKHIAQLIEVDKKVQNTLLITV